VSETFRAKAPWLLYEVTSRLENGMEVYTRKMDASFFRLTLPSVACTGEQGMKKMAMNHLYVFEDRPHWSQIVSISADPVTRIVELRIQRGHYSIAEFMTKHLFHQVTSSLYEDYFSLGCKSCGDTIRLDPRSIPSRPPPKII
jgi:hypothetical protein